MKRPVVNITAAAGGVPLAAVCSACGERWERPEGDTNAATLSTWGHAHVCAPPLPFEAPA